jgi:hypothetical protein
MNMVPTAKDIRGPSPLIAIGVILALIWLVGRLLGDEPPQLVIFDNDFYGPAGSDLQAAALL